jgi:hypothetical protein
MCRDWIEVAVEAFCAWQTDDDAGQPYEYGISVQAYAELFPEILVPEVVELALETYQAHKAARMSEIMATLESDRAGL